MKKDITKNVKWLLLAAAVVAFVVALVISLIPTEANRVTILNPGELHSINGNTQRDIKIQLIKLLQEQNIISEGDTVDDVKIREGSFNTFTQLNDAGSIEVSSFLIDIESLQQTYRITTNQTTQRLTDLAVQIKCPRANEIIYPGDSKCVGTYETNASARHNIPYSATLSSGEKYLVKSITATNKGEHIIQIYLYSCDAKEPPIANTENEVRKWVSELGDDVDYYTYNVRPGYCEGDAI